MFNKIGFIEVRYSKPFEKNFVTWQWNGSNLVIWKNNLLTTCVVTSEVDLMVDNCCSSRWKINLQLIGLALYLIRCHHIHPTMWTNFNTPLGIESVFLILWFCTWYTRDGLNPWSLRNVGPIGLGPVQYVTLEHLSKCKTIPVIMGRRILLTCWSPGERWSWQTWGEIREEKN